VLPSVLVAACLFVSAPLTAAEQNEAVDAFCRTASEFGQVDLTTIKCKLVPVDDNDNECGSPLGRVTDKEEEARTDFLGTRRRLLQSGSSKLVASSVETGVKVVACAAFAKDFLDQVTQLITGIAFSSGSACSAIDRTTIIGTTISPTSSTSSSSTDKTPRSNVTGGGAGNDHTGDTSPSSAPSASDADLLGISGVQTCSSWFAEVQCIPFWFWIVVAVVVLAALGFAYWCCVKGGGLKQLDEEDEEALTNLNAVASRPITQATPPRMPPPSHEAVIHSSPTPPPLPKGVGTGLVTQPSEEPTVQYHFGTLK
jgi:hypothetical protein